MMLGWRKSLSGRLLASVLGALLLSQVVSFFLIWQERKEALELSERTEFVSRVSTLSRLVSTVPADLRADVARAGGTEYTRFWISRGEAESVDAWLADARAQFLVPLDELVGNRNASGEAGHTSTSPRRLTSIEINAVSSSGPWQMVSALGGDLPETAVVTEFDADAGTGLAIPVGQGAVLNAAYYNHFAGSIWRTPFPLTFGLTAGLVAIFVLVTIRQVTRPLARLTAAAENLGKGEATPLPETGPDDIRHTAAAFNRMQDRLHRFMEDRTRMIAAIGHDLRTPLTTLRLRAEFVQDLDLQVRMMGTIDEMRGMTEAILSLAKQEGESETTRTVDLETLVESLCDDLSDIGATVSFHGGTRIPYRCRPDSLRRAVRNLVENAVRYGGQADVVVRTDAERIEILVEDRGPGIPDDRLEDVFKPFVRLEESRNPETGGVGLGLSIARTIARQHGGDIVLSSRKPGLRAALLLPA